MGAIASVFSGGGLSHVSAKKTKRKKTKLRRDLELAGFRWRVLDDALDDEREFDNDSNLAATMRSIARSTLTSYVKIESDDAEGIIYGAGFKRRVSSKYSRMLADIAYDFSDVQLVDRVIDIVTRKFAPLRGPDVRYPFMSDVRDVWFTSVTTMNELRGNPSRSYVNLESRLVVDMLLTLPPREDVDVFYHATSWTSAVLLLNHGPNHNVGRQCMDFGVTGSFYLTPSVEIAEEWVSKNKRPWANEGAILVFFVPRSQKSKKFKTKVFPSANDEWKRLTRASRSCPGGGSIQNELDFCDCVKGPMVANPREVCMGRTPAVHIDGTRTQLASKSSTYDAFLAKALVGAVFFSKFP